MLWNEHTDVNVPLLLVARRETVAEVGRWRAGELIIDWDFEDNVRRNCSHCFVEVAGLDIAGAVSWIEGGGSARRVGGWVWMRSWKNRGGRNWPVRLDGLGLVQHNTSCNTTRLHYSIRVDGIVYNMLNASINQTNPLYQTGP